MTNYGPLHPKNDVEQLCVGRGKRVQGLIGCEVTCVIEYESTYNKTKFKRTLENDHIRTRNDRRMDSFYVICLR